MAQVAAANMLASLQRRSISFLLICSIVAAGLVSGLAMLLTGVAALNAMQEKSAELSEHYLQASVLAQLQRDVNALGDSLSENIREPLLAQNQERIGVILRNLKVNNANLGYIYLVDVNGLILHDGSADNFLRDTPVLDQLPSAVRMQPDTDNVVVGQYLHILRPIKLDGRVYGSLRFSVGYGAAQERAGERAELLLDEQAVFHQRLWKILVCVFTLLVIITLPLGVWLSRRMLGPLKDLAKRSEMYARGQRHLTFDLGRDDEVGQLGLALEKMTASLTETHRGAQVLAYQDTLTALPNRRKFYSMLQKLVAYSLSNDQSFAMFFIDLDFFKQVNDTHGHDVGDELLKVASRRLQAAVKRYRIKHPELDSAETLVSRLGGDEFVLVIPYVAVHHAQDFADLLQQRFERPVDIHGNQFEQTLSIGITYFPMQGMTVKELLKNADIAMYEAKKAGRAVYREFDESMRTEFQKHILIKQSATAALQEEDEFFIEYQPIFCLETERMVGAEALLRWQHPELGRLAPGAFIEALEESGLIAETTLWVLTRVFKDYLQVFQQWPGFKVSINLSSRVFLDQAFSQSMLKLLQRFKIPADFLCIELTETDMMHDIEHCKTVMRAWRNAGVSIWIDDFGTGYSSLSYLNELPIDVLKIDRSFVNELESGDIKPVIQVIHALAKSLTIEVVSEGVETDRQLHLVKHLGSQFGQGYGLCRPITLDKLETVYSNPQPLSSF